LCSVWCRSSYRCCHRPSLRKYPTLCGRAGICSMPHSSSCQPLISGLCPKSTSWQLLCHKSWPTWPQHVANWGTGASCCLRCCCSGSAAAAGR
jgi:hypothetical protein